MGKHSEKYLTISHLNKQHHHIYDLIVMHQKLLMHGDTQTARDKILELKEYANQHLQAENDYLLPLYEKYISPIPAGGAVEFFIHEHHKINRYLDEFCALMLDSDVSSIDLVSLFDRYYKFKHLLDHHHTREDTFLFRLLDRVLSDDEKKNVLGKFVFNDT
jgi:hemerythrin-like domain-containing protein